MTEGQTGVVVCPNCGHDLSDRPPGMPCSECGTVTPHIVIAADFATAVESVSVGYVKRSWQEQWQRVVNGLDLLERAYSGQAGAQTDPRSIPIDFCLASLSFKDWLKHAPASEDDLAAVPAAARDEAETYAMKDGSAIRLTCDVANTAKHFTRRAKETTAEVSEFKPTDSAFRFTIKWTKPDRTTGTRDALDLARQAVADWRDYLNRHGLIGS